MGKVPTAEDLFAILASQEKRLKRVERRIALGPLVLPSDTPIYFDGTTKTTYIMWNSVSSQLEFYINGVLEGYLDSTNTGTKLQNV